MDIKVVKFVDKDNQKSYRIIGINGVFMKSKLPAEYLGEEPHFYRDNLWAKYHLHRKTDTSREVTITCGSQFTEKLFESILEDIKISGKRLEVINDERRKTEKTWKGEETFII